MSNANVSALLSDAAREIASRCGHGRIKRSTFPNGTVRVVVTLDASDRASRAAAEGIVYSRLSAAAIPCQVAVL